MRTSPPDVREPLWQGVPVFDRAGMCGSATLGLDAAHQAVHGARGFTRETLAAWDLLDGFDQVALVVSELTTNAVRHGVTATGHGTEPSPARHGGLPHGEPAPAPVRLFLLHWPDRLVCAVRDPSPAPPEAALAREVEEDVGAESGRGLYLVDCFSDCWGWHPLTTPDAAPSGHWEPDGKVVWALFRLRP